MSVFIFRFTPFLLRVTWETGALLKLVWQAFIFSPRVYTIFLNLLASSEAGCFVFLSLYSLWLLRGYGLVRIGFFAFSVALCIGFWVCPHLFFVSWLTARFLWRWFRLFFWGVQGWETD